MIRYFAAHKARAVRFADLADALVIDRYGFEAAALAILALVR